MPAKILNSFSEENCELEKQIGCMAGIFQIFDRGNLLSGRRLSRHNQKRISSGNSKSRTNGAGQNKSSQQATLEKTLSKSLTENSSLSMESSRASCSSSSCSSFSSINETYFSEKPPKELPKFKNVPNCNDFRDIVKESINRESHKGLTVKTSLRVEMTKKNGGLKHKDSPRPILLSKSVDGTYVIGIDRSHTKVHVCTDAYTAKDVSLYGSRYSCDGRELPNCPSTKLRELPRLSLDSRKESLTRSNVDQVSPGHQRSNSVIAKLMGLELLPDETDNGNISVSVSAWEKSKPVQNYSRKDNLLGNSPKSNFENGDLQKWGTCQSLVVKTKNNSLKIGTESAPWLQQQEKSSTNKRISSEIERRLKALELHAKELLESKSQRICVSPRVYNSPIVIMKPAKYGKIDRNTFSCPVSLVAAGLNTEKTKSFASRGLRVSLSENSAKETPKKSNRESSCNSPRTPGSVSPRLLRKKSESEGKSRPSTPPSGDKKSVNDSISPRGRVKSKPSQVKKILNQRGDSMEPASPSTSNRIARLQHKESPLVIKDNNSDKDLAVVSPVSVLDASFYHGELTPPAKRISDTFKDGETYSSEECWNPTSLPDTPSSKTSGEIKAESIETLIQKLEQLSCLTTDEVPCGNETTQYDPQNKDHHYIHEILSASGLLHKDLDFIVPFAQSECPINPNLFLVLEQTKSDDKIHRKLIFDTVNEIISKKIDSNIAKPRPNGFFLHTKKLGGVELLGELCMEIDKIQAESSCKCVEFDGGDNDNGEENPAILCEETLGEMKGWERFEFELQGMVLEIERSIFKDLIAEIIDFEASEVMQGNKQCRLRRQLLF